MIFVIVTKIWILNIWYLFTFFLLAGLPFKLWFNATKNPFWFMFLKIGRFDLFLLFYIYRELFFNGRSRRQRSWRTTIPSCLRACFSFLLFKYFSFLYSETDDLSFDKIFKYKWNYTKKNPWTFFQNNDIHNPYLKRNFIYF